MTTDKPDLLWRRLSLQGDENGDGERDELELGDRGELGNISGGKGDIDLWLEILFSISNTSSGGMLGGLSVTVLKPVLLFLGESDGGHVDCFWNSCSVACWCDTPAKYSAFLNWFCLPSKLSVTPEWTPHSEARLPISKSLGI